MTNKNNDIYNPVTGQLLFGPAAPISGILLILLASYLYRECKDTKDNLYITSHQWLAVDGYTVGDWLSFDKSDYYKLKNDTLYKHNQPVAIILNIEKTLWGDNELKIKSIQTGELGDYHEK